MITVLAVVVVFWIALIAVVLGMVHAGTSAPTPRPAPERLVTPDGIQLHGDHRQAA
jgi:hypothetical protein